MPIAIVQEVKKSLEEQADDKTKQSFQRFFKKEVKCHGVKSAKVMAISKKYFLKIQERSKEEIFDLAEELLKSGYCEEVWVAANWINWVNLYFVRTDMGLFETWIDKYIDNWAECDTFCNHAVGTFINMYPEELRTLMIWAENKNLWLRRAAAISLIVPAKEGRYLPEIFKIANILLEDKEELVQKGYGWMLKEASRKHEQQVLEYVLKNKAEMPRAALRYAIELMTPEHKAQAMKK